MDHSIFTDMLFVYLCLCLRSRNG